MATITRAPLVVRLNKRGPNDANSRLAHHGWFYYWRIDGMLTYRGLLAFDFLNLAAVHPAVRDIRQRTRAVQWWNGAEWEDYFPRYELVLATDKPGVTHRVDVEVLATQDLRAAAGKYRRIARECREAGRHFLIFTETRIRAEPRLTNARIVLAQAGKHLVSERHLDLVREAVDESSTVSLNGLVASGVLSYPEAYAATLNLVTRGELSFRTSRRFDGETRLQGRA